MTQPDQAAAGTAWRVDGDSVVVRVRLTPKGGRDAVDGVTATAEGPAFKARVRVVPEDGAANAALTSLVAGWLGVPGRDVGLASGHKSRVKSVRVRGDVAWIEQTLAERLGELTRS